MLQGILNTIMKKIEKAKFIASVLRGGMVNTQDKKVQDIMALKLKAVNELYDIATAIKITTKGEAQWRKENSGKLWRL